MPRYITLGALLTALAVILGAFGAHALKNSLHASQMAVYQTAVQYHFYHALGLILVGVSGLKSSQALWSGRMMTLGIILFSGSLYLLTITGVRWLGMITPIGGIGFIIAWVLLAYAAWKRA
jgi:uncharacterized membrane protein YgdD (TMEM256/DUF423 family)